MVDHYTGGLSNEAYEKEFNEAISLVFGDVAIEGVYASLPSLEGVVEFGIGTDTLAAKEDYLEKIQMLMEELNEKRLKIQYDLVGLDYTTVGGV